MEKNTLIIIFLLFFLFSSKLWEVTWDVGKAIVYIMIAIIILNILDKNLSNEIKLGIIDLLNYDSDKPKNNIIIDNITRILKNILDFIKPMPYVANDKIKNIDKIINDYKNLIYEPQPINNVINNNQYQTLYNPKQKDNL
jgi:hypothetical protein